eukprot:scaffold39887_cov63-Phaeocystis_antarctica.AAC.4
MCVVKPYAVCMPSALLFLLHAIYECMTLSRTSTGTAVELDEVGSACYSLQNRVCVVLVELRLHAPVRLCPLSLT